MRFLFVFCLTFYASIAAADTMRMAVTTSFQNSGLADVLVPLIKSDTGVEVQLIVVGTGQALRLGQAGDVDAVLVHARQAEDTFVEDGYAPYRKDIMYNDFVIVGPVTDPAGLTKARDARQAFAALSQGKAGFVSRGDDSGTHKAEQALWDAVPNAPWYKEAGSGMGATLNTAVGLGAYVLTDRASWLNFGNTPDDMVIVFEGDPALFNPYGFLPVSSDLHPHVASGAVAQVERWLTGPKGQAAINAYDLNGVQLFFANAAETQ